MSLLHNKGHTVTSAMSRPDQVTIRRAYPDDADALARLAVLDCRPLPAGDLLVGEVNGTPWATVSISTGAGIADPFRPSAGIVRLLEIRAAQLNAVAGADHRRRLRLPLTARRQAAG